MEEVAGLAWYRREDYPRLLEIFDDPEKLPRTYDDWLVRAEKGRKDFENGGIFTVRVIIDPDEFLQWCVMNGLKLDAKARMRFANLRARDQYRTRN